MASLKSLRNRIKSVKSTQKITKAMKMVAAAKLRRAKEQAEAARPFAEKMEQVLGQLSSSIDVSAGAASLPVLLAGTGRDQTHLLVVATSDRGLCGAFNSSIVRATKKKIAELKSDGKNVKLFCIGKKGFDQLSAHPEYKHMIVEKITEVGKRKIEFFTADRIAKDILELYARENIDVCSIVYNRFRSAISQIVTLQQLIPLPQSEAKAEAGSISYEFEPDEESILADLLPRNMAVQIYRALLENLASEQGARMTAMDNATRNAGDMIKRLNLVYNRTRQATITKELIEIISGAEAV